MSSVPRLSGSMAIRYRELGKRKAAASTLPVTESVSPVMTSSFGTTTISPAEAEAISLVSRPHMRYRCAKRSDLRVRAHTSSRPGLIVPAKTLINERRPICGSLSDLKTNTTGRSSPGSILSFSPLTRGTGPKSTGSGKYSATLFMKEITPSSRTHEPANTGIKMRSQIALCIRPSSSS